MDPAGAEQWLTAWSDMGYTTPSAADPRAMGTCMGPLSRALPMCCWRRCACVVELVGLCRLPVVWLWLLQVLPSTCIMWSS